MFVFVKGIGHGEVYGLGFSERMFSEVWQGKTETGCGVRLNLIFLSVSAIFKVLYESKSCGVVHSFYIKKDETKNSSGL